MMKGDSSNLQVFYYLLTFQIVLFGIFYSYAYSNVSISCPDIFTSGSTNSNLRPINGSNETIVVTQTNYLVYLQIFTSPCSGIPVWFWVIILLPSILSIIVYVLPSWIAGG
jgi:hypothetical protein